MLVGMRIVTILHMRFLVGTKNLLEIELEVILGTMLWQKTYLRFVCVLLCPATLLKTV
jgi:hypothetical protein